MLAGSEEVHFYLLFAYFQYIGYFLIAFAFNVPELDDCPLLFGKSVYQPVHEPELLIALKFFLRSQRLSGNTLQPNLRWPIHHVCSIP